MTTPDFVSLSPLIIIAAAPVVLMLSVTIARNFRAVYIISLVMFLAAFLSLFPAMQNVTRNFDFLLIIDSFGLLFLGIVYLTGILVTILSYEYLMKHGGEREEYFIILFVAVLGASTLVLSGHFITFFLGLETLSISLYVLIAYIRTRGECIEAGIKFLIIASLSTAFLLFGMGLLYAETGTMTFHNIVDASSGTDKLPVVILAGVGLVLAGIAFKLALVPFHMWTPDIYHGAPVPVTAFIATISKGAVLALALRFFFNIRASENNTLAIIISGIAILSMFAGNLLALNQANLKRLLAYSSIAHLGYLLITVMTGTMAGKEAAIFYLAAYSVTTIGAFGVISILSVCERDADKITDYKGLFWSHPWLASVLTLALLSLAGLPLTAGFISKFYVVLAGVKSGLWILAFSLIINSVISLYYYLRVIKTMFGEIPAGRTSVVPAGANFVLALIVIGILFLGLFPQYFTELINNLLTIN